MGRILLLKRCSQNRAGISAKFLGDWAGKGPDWPAPEPNTELTTLTRVIDTEGKNGSWCRLSQPWPRWQSGSYKIAAVSKRVGRKSGTKRYHRDGTMHSVSDVLSFKALSHSRPRFLCILLGIWSQARLTAEKMGTWKTSDKWSFTVWAGRSARTSPQVCTLMWQSGQHISACSSLVTSLTLKLACDEARGQQCVSTYAPSPIPLARTFATHSQQTPLTIKAVAAVRTLLPIH